LGGGPENQKKAKRKDSKVKKMGETGERKSRGPKGVLPAVRTRKTKVGETLRKKKPRGKETSKEGCFLLYRKGGGEAKEGTGNKTGGKEMASHRGHPEKEPPRNREKILGRENDENFHGGDPKKAPWGLKFPKICCGGSSGICLRMQGKKTANLENHSEKRPPGR